MKQYPDIAVIALMVALFFPACTSRDGYKYLDHDFPSKTPKVFAERIVSKPDRYEQYCSFSRDGKEMFISITDRHWNYLGMFCSRLENGQWTEFDTAYFTRNKLDGGEPFVQNNSLYFVSVRHNEDPWHTDIYKAERSGSGWTEAVRLPEPVNSPDNEWHPTFSEDGTMYFGSERTNERYKADIYRSEFINGAYTDPVKLPDSINTAYNDCDPLIAPDESFLIFHSDRPGGVGEHDLYIAFKKEDGSWTPPKNMGPAINSAGWELGPSLSPDGEYLFFTRRKSFETDTPSKIYWVSATVIEDLK